MYVHCTVQQLVTECHYLLWNGSIKFEHNFYEVTLSADAYILVLSKSCTLQVYFILNVFYNEALQAASCNSCLKHRDCCISSIAIIHDAAMKCNINC